MKMKIGLTRTENSDKEQFYVEWLKGNDNIEIVKLSAKNNNLDEINSCDAIVFSGGVDIEPKFYGGKTGYKGAPKNYNEERDIFEIAAFQSAQENKIPVLGVCRGLQLINTALKGTLIQNLGDELNTAHEGNPDKSHTVNIEQGTILHDIAGGEKPEVNSAHHQAIDKPGKELMISARSGEGVVEAVEWKDPAGKPFLLAVQWHPERMFKFQLENSSLSKSLRERFISEIKKSIANKNEDH
jgi:putative glutamine amidotransferase